MKSLTSILALVVVFWLSSTSVLMQGDPVILTLAWNPDGNSLSVGGRDIPTTGVDSRVNFIQSPDAVFNNILALTWNAAGTRLAARVSGGIEGSQIYIWDGKNCITPVITSSFSGASNYHLLKWSPDGQSIAVDEGGIIRIYDAVTGEEASTLYDEDQIGNAGLMGMAWSYDSQHIYSLYDVGATNHLLVWDVKSKLVINSFLPTKQSSDQVYPISLALSPDGIWLAIAISVAGSEPVGSILILDAKTGSESSSVIVPRGASEDVRVPELMWHPNGKYLLGVTYDGVVYVWDIASNQLIDTHYSIGDNEALIRNAALSSYGGQLAILTGPNYGTNPDINRQELLEGSIQIVIPAPSLELLQSIETACVPADVVKTLSSAVTLAENSAAYIEAVRQNGSIAPGCAADLIAVAGAL